MSVLGAEAFGATFVVCALLGSPLIGLLRGLAYRQLAYEDAPQSHQKKTGTPTMGGLLFVLAPLVALLLVHDPLSEALAFLIVGNLGIGMLDDYISVRLGRNRGLGAKVKFTLTLLIAALFLVMVLEAQPVWNLSLLFVGPVSFWVWFLLSLAVVLATTHAVNLTDGLDGLASGTIVPPLLVLIYVAARQGQSGVTAILCAVVGAVLAFLIYNRHPAKMFMGDTGSLALGAALAGGAILTGTQLLLLLIGGVFVAETVSVIVQVASFKTTQRRVFRMSPLHHHFELGGWSETTVTARFWLASLLLGILGFIIVVRT